MMGCGHLPDHRLLSLYLGEEGPTRGDDIEHVRVCPSCARRYRTLGVDIGPIGRTLRSWADRVFTADRLSRQRQHIAARLARLGTPARILEFPHSPVRQSTRRRSSRTTTRWVAAAAAAGLVVGLGTGMLVDHRVHIPASGVLTTSHLAAPLASPLSRSSPVAPPHQLINEDQFLSDVEIAVDESRAPELQALEAFTPRIQEISATLK